MEFRKWRTKKETHFLRIHLVLLAEKLKLFKRSYLNVCIFIDEFDAFLKTAEAALAAAEQTVRDFFIGNLSKLYHVRDNIKVEGANSQKVVFTCFLMYVKMARSILIMAMMRDP